MALPNPHGAAAGEIANNSIYDTGVTPGSTGGKFIGFGEEGTSFIANRAHWALSENIDYLYQIVAGDRAIPAGASFTSAGQSTYQITDDVWCGDAGYPGAVGVFDAAHKEGMLILFAVLDENYNELTDASGNEVRVHIVRDSTNTTEEYKNGFITNPVITFKTIDSSGADVPGGNPYTIPAAQDVRVLYGSKSSVEALPVDALVKFKLQSASEVEAGAFLQDGTKKMTGDADYDGNKILNLDEARGAAGADLLIRAIQDLNLQGDQELTLKDQHLAAAVALSQAGELAVNGYYPSIIGSLNSKTDMLTSLVGNRSLDTAGVLTFTAGTGQVAWPNLNVTIDGERRVIPAGNIIVSNTGTTVYYLAVTALGAVVERTDLQETDIPLTAHAWNGAAFNVAIDLRWAYNKTTRAFEVTCGDGGGTDFGDLDDAVEVAAALSKSSRAPTVVRVKGVAPISSSVNTIVVREPIAIVGEGPGLSTIKSNNATGDANDFIDCQSNQVRIENLTVMHAGNKQLAGLAGIKNAGDFSIFRNLTFEPDTTAFNWNFANAFLWDAAAEGVLIEKVRGGVQCSDQAGGGSFILGSNAAYTTAYLTESRIRDVKLEWGVGGTPEHAIVANGEGNIIENVECRSGVSDFIFIIGSDCMVDKCKASLFTAGGAAPAHVIYKPLAGATYTDMATIKDSFFEQADFGVRLSDLTGLNGKLTIKNCRFSEINLPFDSSGAGTPNPGSNIVIDGNETQYSAWGVFNLDGDIDYKVTNNNMFSVNGDGIFVGFAASAQINNNFIEGFGPLGTYANAIEVSVGPGVVVVSNNIIGSAGAGTGTSQVRSGRRFTFTNNVLIGGDLSGQKGLQLTGVFPLYADNCTIANNLMGNHGDGGIWVRQDCNGCRIENNAFFNEDKWGVWVDNAVDTIISGNAFLSDILGIFSGIGVLVTGTAAGFGSNTQIIGNHFRGVEGIGNGTWYGCIYVVGAVEGAVSDCQIMDNEIFGCGSTDAVLLNQLWAGIYSNGVRTQVQGNNVRVLKGYVGNSTTVGIRVDYEPGSEVSCSQIIGNTVRHNMSDTQNSTLMFGIQVVGNFTHIHTTVSHNVIDFRDTGAPPGGGGGKTTIAIYFQTANSVIAVGNMIPFWNHAAATNWAIDLTLGTNSFVLANITGNPGSLLSNNLNPVVLPPAITSGNLRADFNVGALF
jgi:hypothetical protein